MRNITPSKKVILLSEYKPPDYLVDYVDMDVDIRDANVNVCSILRVIRNRSVKTKTSSLKLKGENQSLKSVFMNGEKLTKDQYHLSDSELTIQDVPNVSEIKIESHHNPYTNTSLSGFYASGPMISTQCEPEGFRRITYFPDRPDVMSKFKVTIHANRKSFPVLLANGNLIKKGLEPENRHYVVWEDPYPKPSYLFAMVAGKFDRVTDKFKTRSGRTVQIEIYVEPGRKSETIFARTAIKKAMKWDEDVFGLEYDLDKFMMVATPFFNFGAMENKGLNIFNDTCVLGKIETATDSTISFIERVVGHEYFHNWTGNRITCRDWFQLSLKEGLTVFREQEFMGDMNSIAVERLTSVRTLRRVQFSEDAGAMSHAVRPDRYEAIDNFYTATVYEKGAEIVRMLKTLLGEEGFRKGFELYIKRHDGQAVTCDEFFNAMKDANKFDFKNFMDWYSQAGTPQLTVNTKYNVKNCSLKVRVSQKTDATPGQKTKKTLPIPLAVGLLDRQGKDMIPTKILFVTEKDQEFILKNINEKPVVSLLRNFSAPVRLIYRQQNEDELLFLLAHDNDPFNKWDACHRLITGLFLDRIRGKAISDHRETKLIAALGMVLKDPSLDPSFKSMVLNIPSEGELGLSIRAEGLLINTESIYSLRRSFVKTIGMKLYQDFLEVYYHMSKVSEHTTDGVSMGQRSLKNICLSYLAATRKKKILSKVYSQAIKSKNMTDTIAALSILIDTASSQKKHALKIFERRWNKVPTVMDKWFSVQATAKNISVIHDIKSLMKHKSFDIKNPNRVSSLIGAFASNGLAFHAGDGSGYAFIAKMIVHLDTINPHSAAALAKCFSRWRDYEKKKQKLMHNQLKYLAMQKKLSRNVAEIVERSLVKQ